MFYNNPVRLLALRSCLALYVVVVTVQSIVAGEWVLLILTSLFFLASLCYILTYLSMWHLDSIHLFSLHASFSCLWQLIDMVSHCSSIPRLRPCTWCWYSVLFRGFKLLIHYTSFYIVSFLLPLPLHPQLFVPVLHHLELQSVDDSADNAAVPHYRRLGRFQSRCLSLYLIL